MMTKQARVIMICTIQAMLGCVRADLDELDIADGEHLTDNQLTRTLRGAEAVMSAMADLDDSAAFQDGDGVSIFGWRR